MEKKKVKKKARREDFMGNEDVYILEQIEPSQYKNLGLDHIIYGLNEILIKKFFKKFSKKVERR